MNKRLAFAAVAAIALSAAPAMAQQTDSATPPATTATPSAAPATAATPPAATPSTATPSTSATPPADEVDDTAAPAASAPSAAASGADVSVTTGMAVKDNTGATIGSVSEVKTSADGKKTATIKMGADVFAVDTNALAVADGSATVNASQAEIKGMLKK